MTILTREQILAIDDLPEETISVSEWGGDIVVRGLTRGEAHAARNACKDKDGLAGCEGGEMRFIRWLKWLIRKKPCYTYTGYYCGLCGTWVDYEFQVAEYKSLGEWWDTWGICPICSRVAIFW